MSVSLETLARIVNGQVIGDGSILIERAASLLDAGLGAITLVDRNEKAEKLAASGATAAVIPAGFSHAALTMPAIQVADVHQSFTLIVAYFRPRAAQPRRHVSPAASVSPWARLDRDVHVHPMAAIGDNVEIGAGSTIHSGAQIMSGCRLGRNVTIYPNAVLYDNTLVGDRSVIHAGAVLGCHGFGYRFVDGRHEPSAQLGNVEVGCDVEIGAGTTIDRGTYGPTLIGDGTKIDNLVMIAHNCRIGRHNMICSQVGIAGSSSTGDYVILAGQVGVKDHVKIGDRAVLGAMAGVTHDVPAGAHMFGIPATDERVQKVRLATLAKLPEMRRQLKALQRVVEQLMPPHQDAARSHDERLRQHEEPGNQAAA